MSLYTLAHQYAFPSNPQFYAALSLFFWHLPFSMARVQKHFLQHQQPYQHHDGQLLKLKLELCLLLD
jgi:hypothetical protein